MRTILAAIIGLAGLTIPTSVGASDMSLLEAQTYTEQTAARRSAHMAYKQRLAMEEAAATNTAKAMVAISVAVSAACEGSCVLLP
ncbi:MAG: hypothetical protein AAF337_00120 [Pseudomonadota bacterium]